MAAKFDQPSDAHAGENGVERRIRSPPDRPGVFHDRKQRPALQTAVPAPLREGAMRKERKVQENNEGRWRKARNPFP
jgi:hypothetical protein